MGSSTTPSSSTFSKASAYLSAVFIPAPSPGAPIGPLFV